MVRRWNGWAEEHDEPRLEPAARRLLGRVVGAGTPPRDATLEAVVAALPPSRLAERGFSTDSVDRIRHSTGQSFPDWVAMRSGRIVATDAVARPTSGDEVRDVFGEARRHGAAVVPFGGGTSVVGGVEPSADRPTITLSLDRLAGLRELDARSGLASFGAGTTGPAADAALAGTGLRVGHTPQSWERATVGGWVAARGAGHESIGVGRIEALFAGGTLEAPAGRLSLPPHPASAAGPDLRQLVLGSEGRLGVLTEATIRLSPAPQHEAVRAWLLPDWSSGVELAREIAQARLPLAMIRLLTPLEVATMLAFAGLPQGSRIARAWLRLTGGGTEPTLLFVIANGSRSIVRAAMDEVARLAARAGARRAPAVVARRWISSRYRSAALRDTLWAEGYGVDTIETAASWAALPDLARAVGRGLRRALDADGERVHAFSHLSHVYPTGSSLYTTVVFRLALDADESLDRWRTLKRVAGDAIVAHGATISHQHGVGRDHRPWLEAEKGPLGLGVLEAARAVLDPDGIMNPGVLLP